MKKILFIISTLFFLILFPALFVCKGVSFGEELGALENEINYYEKENSLLETKIAENSSCQKIFSEAVNSNFSKIVANNHETNAVALNR